MISSSIRPVTSGLLDAPFTGAWQLALGNIDFPLFLLRITNASNVALGVSFDGVNTHDYIAAGYVLQLNIQANAQKDYMPANLAQGSSIYVMGTGGAGLVFVAGYTYYR